MITSCDVSLATTSSVISWLDILLENAVLSPIAYMSGIIHTLAKFGNYSQLQVVALLTQPIFLGKRLFTHIV